MNHIDKSNLSSAFSDASYAIQSVADSITHISTVANIVGQTTTIDLDPDQLISIGPHTIQAKELLLMQRLLKDTYPEEYL